MTLAIRSRMRSFTPHVTWLVIGGLALGFACSRPLDRPLEGARPGRAGEASSGLAVAPPPTISAPRPTTNPSPPPVVIVAASPSPSPAIVARDPILSALLPAPNAFVPPGSVNIGARVSASVDLDEVALTLNGSPVQPQITAQNPKTWLVGYTGKLDVGKHEVRLNAKDRDGRMAGYRWQFDVQPRPFPSPTLIPSPLRLPTPTRS